MYLTYDEYYTMGGGLDANAFNLLEFEAESYIDYMTFARLQKESEIPEKVKRCIYYIINLIANKMSLLNINSGTLEKTEQTAGGVSGYSNDGVSVSFNTLSAKDIMDTSKAELNEAVQRYLQGVTDSLGRKLLYRGIYPDE